MTNKTTRAIDRQRAAFLNIGRVLDAWTLREIRGWPNSLVHNAKCLYDIIGWDFNELDAALIREEAAARASLGGE